MTVRLAMLASLSFAASLLAACAAPSDEARESEASIGEAHEPISGGVVDTKDTEVVAVIADLGGGNFEICSGSLLAPNMVLTAHHCVAGVENSNPSLPEGTVICGESTFSSPYSPGVFFITNQSPAPEELGPAYMFVKQVVVPPSTSNTVCGVDQAILILAAPFTATAATPIVPRVDDVLAADELYSALGYGGITDSGDGAGTRRRRDGLSVGCVGEGCNPKEVAVQEWEGQAGVCEGDSGGPAIDSKGRVVGVTSRGQAGCVEPIYGSVFAWADWIKATAKTAADDGGYAAAPWVNGAPTDPAYTAPVGAACTEPQECTLSKSCFEGYCTRPCSEAGPCPEGYSCNNDTLICEKGYTNGGSSDSGCAMGDPTKPVPWFVAPALVGLALAARRRRPRA